MAIPIEYEYTKYTSKQNFNDPIPKEYYRLIKANKKQFLRTIRKGIIRQFKIQHGLFKRMALYITVICFALVIGVMLISLSGSTILDGIEKSDKFFGIIGVVVILGIIFLPFGLGYYKSRESLDAYMDSIEKYYNVYSNYINESTDYDDYLKILKR